MASTTQLLEELDKTKSRAANARKKAAEKAEQVVGVAATVGGGALAGYVDAKWPNKKLGGVGINLIIGASLTAVGLMEWAGRQSNLVGGLGGGMLGWEAGKAVHARVTKSASTGYVGAGAYPGQFVAPRGTSHDDLNRIYADLRRAAA